MYSVNHTNPLVAVIMGSKSDWDTMRHSSDTLVEFEVPHESLIISAHRTPARMAEYAGAAQDRGIEIIEQGIDRRAQFQHQRGVNQVLAAGAQARREARRALQLAATGCLRRRRRCEQPECRQTGEKRKVCSAQLIFLPGLKTAS